MLLLCSAKLSLNDPEYREIPCGASHGFGTARGLGKLMGILANGGVWEEKTASVSPLNQTPPHTPLQVTMTEWCSATSRTVTGDDHHECDG